MARQGPLSPQPCPCAAFRLMTSCGSEMVCVSGSSARAARFALFESRSNSRMLRIVSPRRRRWIGPSRHAARADSLSSVPTSSRSSSTARGGVLVLVYEHVSNRRRSAPRRRKRLQQLTVVMMGRRAIAAAWRTAAVELLTLCVSLLDELSGRRRTVPSRELVLEVADLGGDAARRESASGRGRGRGRPAHQRSDSPGRR